MRRCGQPPDRQLGSIARHVFRKKPGDIVSVRISFTYRPITPIAAVIIGSVARSASASMAIN